MSERSWRGRRQVAELTQAELAEGAHLPVETVKAIEAGAPPTDEAREALDLILEGEGA